jgi:hypothetical protein
MMRGRIIFRGLTLFTFKQSTAGASDGANLGTLTALLISDPACAGMPLHEHTPHLGMLGREVGALPGRARVRAKGRLPKEVTIELKGHGVPAGVRVDSSFLDYVPRLDDLNQDARVTQLDERYVTRKIIIPSGRIRTRDFIAWDWHGSIPTKVAYMDTNVQGFAATEVIVDVGDDSDYEKPDRKKHLAIDSRDGAMHEKLWPYARGGEYAQAVDPNTAEVLISNLPARRRRPVFWGLHFQTLFQAAGFPGRTGYSNTLQYQAFVNAATAYDADEWQSEMAMMGHSMPYQPFPFLIDIDRQADRLTPLAKAASPYVLKGPPPPPAGRQQGEGKLRQPRSPHGHHHGGMGHDPENYQMCPHAVTDI